VKDIMPGQISYPYTYCGESPPSRSLRV
jgi:hypothetical protein